MFAQNLLKFCSIFGRVFSHATQAKVCTKFGEFFSIFGRIFFMLHSHRQKFAQNFMHFYTIFGKIFFPFELCLPFLV